ncbi:hypothetical protein ACI68E_002356 [Malassezia pachydermatis]|uniref:Fe2OG dioxygenase domain-containing protein n=1 Tax=Malassezia pachydermatis TaxID=77020 RepID=A0A0M8MQW7_9BASI|nr:hypothetical protein Malapachy_0851 [Malassezia pachydermatis]KOS15017.1 hypothetical protein Malapachy_0851 [Malassezia pachydermatis]
MSLPPPLSMPGQAMSHGGFVYMPAFISEAEETQLLAKIDTAPKTRWKQLAHRRLQMWGGTLTERTGTLIPEPLPPWMTAYPALVERLAASGAFRESSHQAPNHCLVNDYFPGQGILPHTDGPAYDPVVATISLGGHTVLDIYEHTPDKPTPAQPSFVIVQEPRSLLITYGEAYTRFKHGIAERVHDTPEDRVHVLNASHLSGVYADPQATWTRERRVSLTFRDVARVHKGLMLRP